MPRLASYLRFYDVPMVPACIAILDPFPSLNLFPRDFAPHS